MPVTIEHLPIEEIKKRLAPLFKDEGLRLVILFGSVACGGTHRGSDVDLGFLYDGDTDILALTERVVKLLSTDAVDVVDLGRASPLLKFSASRNCRVLFERRPGEFSEFCSLAFRRYVDTKKLRDAGRTVIKNFLSERGLR